MSMKSELQEAMKSALRAKERVKLDTIRLLLSAMQYEEMQRGIDELPDDAVMPVLQRELKKRKEELEFAEKANRNDLKEKLALEVSTIEEFLPKQLSNEELEIIIVQIKNETPTTINMGAVMKSLQERHAGRYNGKAASEIVKRMLGS